MTEFNIIVAISKNNGIGLNNTLPWDLPEDLKYFKKITTQTTDKDLKNVVIMGRNTWESIPSKFRPLKDRINVILTSSAISSSDNEYILVFKNFDEALTKINKIKHEQIFVIGGERLYREAIQHQNCRKLYITKIHKDFNCDRFFPQLEGKEYKLDNESSWYPSKDGFGYQFVTYDRIRNGHPEYQYLDKIKEIITYGNIRPDRTGTGTKSLFGCQMRYDIGEFFPLLTTKRVFFRGILAELLWFLNGKTDAKLLQDKNVHIWNENTSRKFLDSHNLEHYEEGDIGAGYSFQFRHAGAEYLGCDKDYTGQGVDQVAECLRLIREDPSSRRILINLWSVPDLKKMVLPPCFTKNMMVLTKCGYKNIGRVMMSDQLYSHMGNYQDIKKIYKTPYSGKLYRFEIENHPHIIEATPNHPFYARVMKYDGVMLNTDECPKFINARDLTARHYIGMKINGNSTMPAFCLRTKDKRRRIKKVNNCGEWFFLGYFLKYGGLTGDKQYYLLSNKEYEMDEFKLIYDIVARYKKYSIIKFKNNIWKGILKELSYPERKKYIPYWIHNAPIKFITKFIEGYFSKNWCRVGKENFAHTTTMSKDVVFSIQRLLSKVGYYCELKQEHDYYTIFFRPEHMDFKKAYIDDGYIWYPIKNIDTINVNNIYVYNFDVKNDHTYTVENLAVHNCHMVYQFYVHDGKLSCSMYQRSGDMGLGVPFNIASASLMTYIFAKLSGLSPGEFIHTIGDAHIYMNHMNALKKQIERIPRQLPILKINDKKEYHTVEDFDADDFKLKYYCPYPSIKMEMAV